MDSVTQNEKLMSGKSTFIFEYHGETHEVSGERTAIEALIRRHHSLEATVQRALAEGTDMRRDALRFVTLMGALLADLRQEAGQGEMTPEQTRIKEAFERAPLDGPEAPALTLDALRAILDEAMR